MPKQTVPTIKATRKIYVTPLVRFSFDQDGEKWYKLDNGNTISKANYDLHYGVIKLPVLPKGTKDTDNPLKAEKTNRGLTSYKQSKV